MDFIAGLPATKRDSNGKWVIIDKLTKSAHFLPVWMRLGLYVLAKLYVDEIVSLHGVLMSIVLDREPCFTLHFLGVPTASLGHSIEFQHRLSSANR